MTPRNDQEDLPILETHMAPELSGQRPEELRIVEALLFASADPVEQSVLAKRLPADADITEVLARLQAEYSSSGIHLHQTGSRWAFRTAADLGQKVAKALRIGKPDMRKLSRAAVETLTIIAYMQPVTRAEIDALRGVTMSNLDALMETGWVHPRGRRKVPGRPLTYGTTKEFLSHFNLTGIGALPPLSECEDIGLVAAALAGDISLPSILEDEEPLEPGDLDLTLGGRHEDGQT